MFSKLFKYIDDGVDLLIVVSFSAMCIVILLGVLTRYIFSYSLPWVEEIGRFLFLAVSYLGIILGMKGQNHLRVDALLLWMPKPLAKSCEFISQLICAAFFLFIVWQGFAMTAKVFRLGQTALAIPLPIWIVWACIPSCAFLSALQCLRHAARIIRGSREEEA